MAQTKPVIKTVPPAYTAPSSGADMYKAYCASCHGADGKGNGPAAPALKRTPTDLTKLSAQNGGKFPELRVYNSIIGDTGVDAHGTGNMPVWGTVFERMSDSRSEHTMLRVRNLTKQIEMMQKK